MQRLRRLRIRQNGIDDPTEACFTCKKTIFAISAFSCRLSAGLASQNYNGQKFDALKRVRNQNWKTVKKGPINWFTISQKKTKSSKETQRYFYRLSIMISLSLESYSQLGKKKEFSLSGARKEFLRQCIIHSPALKNEIFL